MGDVRQHRRQAAGQAAIVAACLGTFACGLSVQGMGAPDEVASGSKTDPPSSGASSAAPSNDSNGGSSAALSSGSSSGAGPSGPDAGDDGDDGDAEGTAPSGPCGAGDPNLPAEPTIPPACMTLTASQPVSAGTLPDESTLDTTTIQNALDACAPSDVTAPVSVRLTAGGANNAFVSGPLTLPSGVTLWIDSGVTLYASLDPSQYGSSCLGSGNCTSLVTATGMNSGVAGAGVIDGQGGEPVLGQQGQSWWDLNAAGTEGTPTLIETSGASNFTLYEITLHNSAREHVKLDADGFIVWGITIKTPSEATNSQGTALSPSMASSTSGINPGESASNGFIVCSDISTGDDQIALKGGVSIDGITIAHNHFLAGDGMSIGSETNGGVSNVDVYDLSIDGTDSGMQDVANGIRIKSDPSVGGLVSNVTYSDVCVREVANPIVMTPNFTSATGTSIPEYTGILIQDFHSLASSDVTPAVTLDGYDAEHLLGITLDNAIVDGIEASNVAAVNANVTLGPGNVNFVPSGTDVTTTNAISGASTPNACTGKWVTF